MATNAVTIHAWKADHTSGTKFYHVIRFVSANGHSFALRQNGAEKLFTGLGKMSTGAIALDEELTGSISAGGKKISAKTSDGYTRGMVNTSIECPTISDAIDHIRKVFGAAPQTTARNILMKAAWAFTPPPAAVEPATPKKPREKDEPDAKKHADWGSW